MALLFLDSFDYSDVYPTTSSADFTENLARKYDFADMTTNNIGKAVAGAHSGVACQFGNVGHIITTQELRDSSVESAGIVGWRMKIHNDWAISDNRTWLTVFAGGAAQLAFRVNASGTLSAYRGDFSFLETTTDSLVATNQGWMYMELKFTIHDSTGNWILKRDGTTIWTSSTYDTRSISGQYWDRIQFKLADIARDTIIDDIYICDGSGSVNNNFLGDTVVENISPSSDGDSSTFTPSTGTNHSALVDEAQSMLDALDETDYVEGDATAEKDLWQYDNLAVLDTATLIHGVQVNTWRRITAEQPISLDVITKTGTTEASKTSTIRQDQTTEMFSHLEIFETDPDTAAAWTPSGVDGAQFGVEMP